MAWTAISRKRGHNELVMIDEPELSLWLHRQQRLLDDIRDLMGLDEDAEKLRFKEMLKIWQTHLSHPPERDAVQNSIIVQGEYESVEVSPLSLARCRLIVASHSPYVKGLRDVSTLINEEE
jgi:hypothetical protein